MPSILRSLVPCSSRSSVIFAALAASCSSKRRTSAMSSLASSTRIGLGRCGGEVRATALVALTGVSEVGAPPAISSRSSACNWLTARVLLWDRLTRRSSRESERVGGGLRGRPDAHRPAALRHWLSAAASMRVVLAATRRARVPGPARSRSSEWSRTTSPRASSHSAKWCPSPSAFSIAQVRSGHAFAQAISRW